MAGESLFTGHWCPDLEAAFLRVYRESARKKIESFLLLTPCADLHRHLTRRLGETLGGYSGLFSCTLEEAAREICLASQVSDFSLLPDSLREILVEECLDSSGNRAAVAARGLSRAACRSIRDLKRAGVPPELCARSSPSASRGSEIFERYRERLRRTGFRDGDDILELAAGLAGSSFWLKRFSRTFLYGFSRLTWLERRFIHAAAAATRMDAFLPHSPNRAFPPVNSLIDWFSEHGFRRSPVASVPVEMPASLRELRGNLFGRFRNRVGPDAGVSILCADDEIQEAESVAGAVWHWAEQGVRFDRMAVAVRDPRFHLPCVRDTLIARGIPVETSTRALSEIPEGRLLLAVLDLFFRDFHREALEKLTANPSLDAACILQEHSEGFRPSEWNWLGNRLHAVQGSERWEKSLDAFLGKGFERFVRENPMRDGAFWEKSAVALRAFLAFWQRTFAQWRAAKNWRAFLGEFTASFARACAPSPQRDRILRVSNNLGCLDELGASFSLESFERLVAAALESEPFGAEEERGVPAPARGGVLLLPAQDASGIAKDLVIIPRMLEREFPTFAFEDPILGDDARRAINEGLRRSGHEGRLDLSRSEAENEALLFQSLVAGTRKCLTLTFSRQEETSGKERLPSPFLLEIDRILTGTEREPSNFHSSELVRFVPKNLHFSEEACVHPWIYDLQLVRKFAQAKLPPPELPEHSLSAQAVQGRLMRENSREFTCREGVLKSPESLAFLRKHIECAGAFSPRALETYATCPFRYFARFVLELPAHGEETAFSNLPSSRQKSLLTAVLSRLPERKSLPEILGEVYSSSEFAHVYPEMLWSVEKERMLENLQCVPDGFLPAPDSGEIRSGVPYEISLALPENSREIRIGGILDQIRFEPSGTMQGVQYHIGGTDRKDDRFHGGRALSACAEMLALGESFPETRVEKVAHEYLERSGAVREVACSGHDLQKKRQTLAEICGLILQGIEAGFYFPFPNPLCLSCPHSEPCGPLREEIYRTKKHDPRISFFLRLQSAEE